MTKEFREDYCILTLVKSDFVPPCDGKVEYRKHWNLTLCERHYAATLEPPLNDILSAEYKEIFPEENHRWTPR